MKAVVTTLILIYLNAAYGSFFISYSCNMQQSVNDQSPTECTCSMHSQNDHEEHSCCMAETKNTDQTQPREAKDVKVVNDCCALIVNIKQADDALVFSVSSVDMDASVVTGFQPNSQESLQNILSKANSFSTLVIPPLNLPLII